MLDRERILAKIDLMDGYVGELRMVHEYGGIDDAIVYKAALSRVQDFERFKREVLHALREP